MGAVGERKPSFRRVTVNLANVMVPPVVAVHPQNVTNINFNKTFNNHNFLFLHREKAFIR